MFSEEPVQFSFTPSEIHQLLSCFETGLPVHSPSGSETCPGRTVYSLEERKKWRMISNRESARRSRWRKKRHLENLTSQVNRLSLENQELKNRLCLASRQCIVAERETNRLMTQSLLLQQRLSGLCQILDNMHLLAPITI